MMTIAFLLTMLESAAVSAQQTPTTGYAPVNGLKIYYEVHGSGEPVVLLHGAFMTITNNWTGWIGELSKTRKVIAIEMQGHGRTADIKRDFSHENLADDVAALLDYLNIKQADVIGYSLGGGVAMQCAIRHPEKVRKVVSISAVFRHDGWVKEALDTFPRLTPETFKGSPIETEYKKLSPTPNEFPNLVKRVVAKQLKPYDFGADKLKATKAPMFFIHGDADGVRLEHISEMFRLKGDEIFGDLRPRSASRLAILPNTTHVTLMERMPVIVPMVNDFFDAKPQNLTTSLSKQESTNLVSPVTDRLGAVLEKQQSSGKVGPSNATTIAIDADMKPISETPPALFTNLDKPGTAPFQGRIIYCLWHQQNAPLWDAHFVDKIRDFFDVGVVGAHKFECRLGTLHQNAERLGANAQLFP
jgi:pimeloyl-ACP methyl ester carboxylesterase